MQGHRECSRRTPIKAVHHISRGGGNSPGKGVRKPEEIRMPKKHGTGSSSDNQSTHPWEVHISPVQDASAAPHDRPTKSSACISSTELSTVKRTWKILGDSIMHHLSIIVSQPQWSMQERAPPPSFPLILRFQLYHEEYHKSLTQRQQLDGQLNENTAVKQELDLLKSGGEVYKLIGPVLVKQDLEEAKQNVTKRMDYIRSELKRTDDLLSGLDKKQDAHREAISKLQQQYQQAQVKASMKT
uniref:Probable prefoldin subunit 6 n=1 Tax=Timema douglasi TaxID=61478 RepID=A0A7R8ZAL2_TIMDO|nr:unnamed protein product [Timema douglasi]